jgi:large subunit ribosomal protein L30
MAEKKSEKILVIRVRGKVNLSEPLKSTFNMLNLHNKNWCIVLDSTPSNMGMIKKVKDYVTWGEITEENYNLLFEKKGEVFKERLEDSKSLIKYSNYLTHKGKKYKKYFRLNPPKKGYGRAGVKTNFSKSGALGYRKEKINDLLERMM